MSRRLLLLLTLLLVVSGCVTVNTSCQQGEKNTVKSDQDQTPTTPISTVVKVPLIN